MLFKNNARFTKFICRTAWIISGVLLCISFFCFRHGDSQNVIKMGLTFSLSNPFGYYDALLANNYQLGYLPSTAFILALWFAPLKYIGLVFPKDQIIYIYWYKALLVAFFILSMYLILLIAREYKSKERWEKYTMLVFASSPIIIYSLFIFSQCDIFYITFMLCGFLLMLRGQFLGAALLFGISITFKFQPIYVFFPLLLLFEKKLWRFILYCFVFLMPMIILVWIYKGTSSSEALALLQKTKHITKLFQHKLDFTGSGHLYLLLCSFLLICGIAYFNNNKSHEALKRYASYILLAAPVCSLLFGKFNPYMAIFMCPGVALTTMMVRDEDKRSKLLFLDIVGALTLIGWSSIQWFGHGGVNESMFMGWMGWDIQGIFGVELIPSVKPMGELFMSPILRLLGPSHGLGRAALAGVYHTCFIAYLLLQLILKFDLARGGQAEINEIQSVYRAPILTRFILGALLFLAPASYSLYKTYTFSVTYSRVGIIKNTSSHPGELSKGSVWEQTFVAKGRRIKYLELQFATFRRVNKCTVNVELLDVNKKVIEKKSIAGETIEDGMFKKITFDDAVTTPGSIYTIRVTSPDMTSKNAITWWTNTKNAYKEGEAVINGKPKENVDFLFQVLFVR